jgi:hypothetical protein
MRRSDFPRASVRAHLEHARRTPLRAAGTFTAIGLASVLGYSLGLAAAIGLGALISATLEKRSLPPAAPAHATETRSPSGGASRPIRNASRATGTPRASDGP